MSTELVTREPRSLATMTTDQLQYIANTDFVPKGLRGNMPAILACVATGRALGLSDMNALRSIHIVDGRASYSAELMVQLVRRAGHSITGTVSSEGATVTGRRADNGDEMTFTFGPDDAARAGLASKPNYQKHPQSMYWARAVSQLCRMLFADVFTGGPAYTGDEVELTPEERVDEAIGEARAPRDDGPVDVIEIDAAPEAEGQTPTFAVPAEVEKDPAVRAAAEAGLYVIPNGQHAGLTLEQLALDHPDKAETWFKWAITNVQNAEAHAAIEAFCRVRFPEVLPA